MCDYNKNVQRDWRSDYRGGELNEGPESNKHEDRTWWDRAGDEMLSWTGDDYAIRRRRHDGPHRGKGPKNYVRSDERIREDINDRLTDEWNVDASDIEVSVSNGEVILTGYVMDLFQKRRAEKVAESVSGVKQVENQIKVDPEVPKDNLELLP
jgi:osmotically-inducible protein OsmY